MIKKVALEDIAEEITPGFACRPVGEGVGVLQMRPYSITEEGKFDFSQSKYVPCGFDDLEKYKMLKGDVLFNNTNSPVLVGKTALFNHDYDCVYSNHMTRIRIRKGLADPGYVARYLHSLFLNGIFKIRCQQWVNQAAISRTELGKLKIPLPSIDEQKSINDMLSQIESVLEKRRQTLRLADEFLKSAFLEMFGDPARNPKKLDVVPCGAIASHVSSGSTPLGGDKTYLKEGILFIRSQNVLMNRLDLSDVAYISNEVHQRMKRTWVKKDDVLLNITGASIGRVAFFEGEDDTANVNQHVCIIRPDKNKVLPQYLSFLISMSNYQKTILGKNAGATRQAFNFDQIKRFQIPLAPLPEQQKFAGLVQKVEKLKEKQKQSETQLQNLFNSLMQGAFKGEIFL